MIYQGIALMTLLTVAALFVAAMRMRRTGAAKELPPFSEGGPSDAPRDSTPPISDGLKLVAKTGGATAREQRKEETRARIATRLCLYCDLPATEAQPIVVLPISWLDGVYRKIGVVPVARWVVRPRPRGGIFAAFFATSEQIAAAHPVCLCATHHAIARSHLERKVAENQTDYAAFVSKQRLEMYEYQAHGLDETMLNDANEIRRGKQRKRNQDAAAPRASLKAVGGGQ